MVGMAAGRRDVMRVLFKEQINFQHFSLCTSEPEFSGRKLENAN
jgi:hypothetical protein